MINDKLTPLMNLKLQELAKHHALCIVLFPEVCISPEEEKNKRCLKKQRATHPICKKEFIVQVIVTEP